MKKLSQTILKKNILQYLIFRNVICWKGSVLRQRREIQSDNNCDGVSYEEECMLLS